MSLTQRVQQGTIQSPLDIHTIQSYDDIPTAFRLFCTIASRPRLWGRGLLSPVSDPRSPTFVKSGHFNLLTLESVAAQHGYVANEDKQQERLAELQRGLVTQYLNEAEVKNDGTDNGNGIGNGNGKKNKLSYDRIRGVAFLSVGVLELLKDFASTLPSVPVRCGVRMYNQQGGRVLVEDDNSRHYDVAGDGDFAEDRLCVHFCNGNKYLSFWTGRDGREEQRIGEAPFNLKRTGWHWMNGNVRTMCKPPIYHEAHYDDGVLHTNDGTTCDLTFILTTDIALTPEQLQASIPVIERCVLRTAAMLTATLATSSSTTVQDDDGNVVGKQMKTTTDLRERSSSIPPTAPCATTTTTTTTTLMPNTPDISDTSNTSNTPNELPPSGRWDGDEEVDAEEEWDDAHPLPQMWVPGTESLAPWVGTPGEWIVPILKRVNITTDDVLCDVGCGDGRIPIIARQHFGVRRAVGIDIDESLIITAKAHAKRRLGAEDEGIEFIFGDALKEDLSDVTLMVVYLLMDSFEILGPLFNAHLSRPGRRLVVMGWKLPVLVPYDEMECGAEETATSGMVYYYDKSSLR